MLQQIGDPLSVFHVCLPPRDSFDMLSIDYQHFKTAFRASLNTGFQYTPVARDRRYGYILALSANHRAVTTLPWWSNRSGILCGTDHWMCVSTNTPSRSSYARPILRSWCRESPLLTTPVFFFLAVKGCSGLDRQKRRFSSTCCWRKASSRQRNKGWFLRLSGPVSWSGSSAQVASDLCVGTSPPILRFFLGGGVALHERLVGCANRR